MAIFFAPIVATSTNIAGLNPILFFNFLHKYQIAICWSLRQQKAGLLIVIELANARANLIIVYSNDCDCHPLPNGIVTLSTSVQQTPMITTESLYSSNVRGNTVFFWYFFSRFLTFSPFVKQVVNFFLFRDAAVIFLPRMRKISLRWEKKTITRN